MNQTSSSNPIVLFDGVCNLCNSSVQFIIDRDRQGLIHFASLQSEQGRDLLAKHGLPEDVLDSIVLIEGESAYMRSTAALRIARQMNAPWPLMYGLIVIPRFIRDAVYKLIARNRYRWFGKSESCRMPTPELAERFLS